MAFKQTLSELVSDDMKHKESISYRKKSADAWADEADSSLPTRKISDRC